MALKKHFYILMLLMNCILFLPTVQIYGNDANWTTFHSTSHEVDKATLDAIKAISQSLSLSLRDIPEIILNFSVSAETFDRIVSLGKFSVGMGFTILGGIIIKNGSANLGDKEKHNSGVIQISCGIIMTIAGTIAMYMQGKTPTIPAK